MDEVLAASRSQVIEIAPIRLEVVNGLGAGDAFGGTLAHGLVRGWHLEHTLTLANAAGALAASRLTCADDFGTPAEIAGCLGIFGHGNVAGIGPLPVRGVAPVPPGA